jgi:hypothetical protein
MKTTTNPMYPSYKLTNLVNYINESGTVTLSQPLPSTSIYATTIDGELTDVINIKDSFNRLPKKEKLKIVSELLKWCAYETLKLTSKNI